MTIPVMIITIIVAAITTVGAGVWGAKRNNISGAKEVTESALLLIKPQSERINELIAAVDDMSTTVSLLQIQIEMLETHVESLSKQIISLGHTPVTWENTR